MKIWKQNYPFLIGMKLNYVLTKQSFEYDRSRKKYRATRAESSTSSFEQLIDAAIKLMVFTKFSHFAKIFLHKKISLHLLLRKS